MKILITSAHDGDLTLPCGLTVPARGSVATTAERLDAHHDHPIVRYWFKNRMLAAAPAEDDIEDDAPAGSDEVEVGPGETDDEQSETPGYAIVETEDGFNVLVDGEPLNPDPFETREAAEAFAAGDLTEV